MRYWRLLRHEILNYGPKAGGGCILYADNHEFGMEHAPRGGQACCGIVLANEFIFVCKYSTCEDVLVRYTGFPIIGFPAVLYIVL